MQNKLFLNIQPAKCSSNFFIERIFTKIVRIFKFLIFLKINSKILEQVYDIDV